MAASSRASGSARTATRASSRRSPEPAPRACAPGRASCPSQEPARSVAPASGRPVCLPLLSRPLRPRTWSAPPPDPPLGFAPSPNEALMPLRFDTLAIHAGQEPDPTTGAIMTPVYLTSTYVQAGPGEHKGYEYSRTRNPTREALEGCLAALEGAR